MDELIRILSLVKDQRTAEDLAYLEEHKSELNEDQLKQLEEEAKQSEEIVEKEVYAKRDLTAHVEVKDLGDSEVEVIVNSGELDRHGEVLSVEGINIKRYMKNPVVQWAHDYSQPPIAKATKVWKDGKKLMSRMKFATAEYPFAKTIYDLVKGGFLNAVSIGFIPQEMEGNTYTKSEMIEYSIVPIPADSSALMTARTLGIDTAFLEGYNLKHMYKLEDILKKSVNDLTVGEIKFLKEHVEDLTGNQIKQYASVLKTEEDKTNTEEDKDKKPAPSADVEKTVAELKAQVEKLAGNENVVSKDIAGQHKTVNTNKGAGEVSKEKKLLYYIRGVKSGNFNQYLNVVGKDAMNSTDDSQVLPPAEFVAEVERLEEQYGVAMQFANVRRSTNGNGITFLSGDDDLEIFETDQAGFKKSTKLSYAQKTLLWRKFAGILPMTDELTEDSAVDLWNDATNRFARAYAKKADYIVFMETSGTTPKNKGITEVSGTNIVNLSGDSIDDMTYDDLVDMIYGVPSPSGDTGRFYFKRDVLGALMKIKDEQGKPIWLPSVAGGAPATILNRPYTLTEILPGVADDAASLKFMVYGDLRYVTLGERTGLNLKMFDTGIVGDPDEEDQEANTLNLLTQDMQALRAVKRMNSVVRFPAAFSVMKTAASS